jgi:hypothetical protein
MNSTPPSPEAARQPASAAGLRAAQGSEIERELAQLRAIQPKQIRNLLVRHGIVDACAIEDPEGYDAHKTWDAVNRFALELQQTLFPNESR